MLAILRNPIDRAFSDYQAFVRDSLERAPFGEAIRRPPGIEPGSQYVMTGFYGRQLQPYFETFGADRVKVILNEDLRVDAKHVLDDVCEWLGVDPMPDSAALANQFNVSGRPRNSAVALAYKLRRVSRPWAKPIVPERLQRGVDSILANGLQRESVPPAVRSELIGASGGCAGRTRLPGHRCGQVRDDVAELLPAPASRHLLRPREGEPLLPLRGPAAGLPWSE